MTRPPSSIPTSACRPCDNSDHDSGNVTCAFFFCMPCARSILFPIAAIMQCDIGNSHPANSLWKKLIAAKYPLTVDCRFLCTKHRDAMNPSGSDNTSLGSASVCNHGSFPAPVSLLPRCSTSLDSFSVCSSRLNRARAFQLVALPRPCVLPCCPLFLQGRV